MFSEIFYLNICKHVYARSRLQCKVSLFDAGARVRDVAATPTPSRFGAPALGAPALERAFAVGPSRSGAHIVAWLSALLEPRYSGRFIKFIGVLLFAK